MNTIKKFVKLQKKAFAESDIIEAQRLLNKLKKDQKKQQSWNYLRSNKIVGYKELYRKLRDMSESLSQVGSQQ